MQNIPVGAVLTDGSNTFTATAAQTSVDITQWNTGSLSITPPAGFYGTMSLTVLATATAPSNGSMASATQSIAVTVQQSTKTEAVKSLARAEVVASSVQVTAQPEVQEAVATGAGATQATLSGMPVGTTLSDGIHSATTTAANPSVDITGWNTGALAVTTPVGYNGNTRNARQESRVRGLGQQRAGSGGRPH
jgi:hypothetical protein